MTARRRRTATTAAATVAALAVGLLASGCTLEEAAPDQAATTAATTPARGAEAPDPRAEALAPEVSALRASVGEARDALRTAMAGGADAADAAELAVALLTADDELAPARDDLPAEPLFPGRATARGDGVDYGDSFTEALTVARAAGAAGGPLVDLLRDPLAGDLGAWQRGADGILDAVDDAARATGDLDAAEAAVAELPGEGTKALAWAVLADRADDQDDRAAFAERGLAHLDLIIAAIDELAAVDVTPDG